MPDFNQRVNQNFTIEEIEEAIKEHGSQRAAAKALGIPRSTLNDRVRTRRTNEPFLEREAGEIGFPVEEVSGYWVKSESGSYWVKRPKETSIENTAEYFKEAFASITGTFKPSPLNHHSDRELLTVYPIPDAHVGMMAWSQEAGEDWDLKIAEKVIVETFENLVSQSKPSEKALLVNLGDFFHINDSKNETPGHGHTLDVDSRYSKVIFTGVRIMKRMIDIALSKHDFIEIKTIKGNHDKDACVALIVGLCSAYENEPRVKVDISPRQLNYFPFGKNLLGFYHGHTMKAERAAMTMACESPEFSACSYRYMMHGHIHTATSKEIGNVLVESFQTIIPRDSYAADSGYYSGRSLSAITYHVDQGEIGRHKVNVS